MGRSCFNCYRAACHRSSVPILLANVKVSNYVLLLHSESYKGLKLMLLPSNFENPRTMTHDSASGTELESRTGER